MSTHTVKAVSEYDLVNTLGRVLSRYFLALSDFEVSSMLRRVLSYNGTLTLSPEFSRLDMLAPSYGVVWTFSNDSMFTVEF